MDEKTSPHDIDHDRSCALRRQRALYYALKSSDDAYFSFIPRQQLLYVLKNNFYKYRPGAKRPRRRPVRYDCQTQTTGTLEWRLISLPSTLNLWESGTVLKWTARAATSGGSAAGSASALMAAVNMWHATEYWNNIMDGRLTFRYVDDIHTSDIILQPGSTTRGFFPCNSTVMNTLTYDGNASYWDFVHELAHVVGLPHENTHSVHPDWSRNLYGHNNNVDINKNGNDNSIWLGTCDVHSVAGYHAANAATENDTLVIRNAYDSLQDGQFLSATIGTGKFSAHLSTVVRRISPPSAD